MRLPRFFTVTGQKFILDSWAQTKPTYDDLLTDQPDDWPRIKDGKVIRKRSSGLDVAYSVFGNDQITPEIATRIANENGMPFREGLPYPHNLLAAKTVIDSQYPESWWDNIYTGWLGALRSLSSPTVGNEYPEAMRTRAWAMKTVNTQLASWKQLRHDTVLYAKQAYAAQVLCEYPAG